MGDNKLHVSIFVHAGFCKYRCVIFYTVNLRDGVCFIALSCRYTCPVIIGSCDGCCTISIKHINFNGVGAHLIVVIIVIPDMLNRYRDVFDRNRSRCRRYCGFWSRLWRRCRRFGWFGSCAGACYRYIHVAIIVGIARDDICIVLDLYGFYCIVLIGQVLSNGSPCIFLIHFEDSNRKFPDIVDCCDRGFGAIFAIIICIVPHCSNRNINRLGFWCFGRRRCRSGSFSRNGSRLLSGSRSFGRFWFFRGFGFLCRLRSRCWFIIRLNKRTGVTPLVALGLRGQALCHDAAVIIAGVQRYICVWS